MPVMPGFGRKEGREFRAALSYTVLCVQKNNEAKAVPLFPGSARCVAVGDAFGCWGSLLDRFTLTPHH